MLMLIFGDFHLIYLLLRDRQRKSSSVVLCDHMNTRKMKLERGRDNHKQKLMRANQIQSVVDVEKNTYFFRVRIFVVVQLTFYVH